MAAQRAERGARGIDPLHVVGVGVLSGLLFTVGLLVAEAPGELALDVDLKPFFLPYLLIAVVRYGFLTLSAGLGAAIGEGALDVAEGYELDDPVGFIGYVVGFTLFGWYLHRVANDPTARRAQTVAAILGAFGQAVFEGLAFLVFATDASPLDAGASVVGNTVTHGVVLGAIPLVVLYPWLEPLVEKESGESD
ncbi:hypothetical protein [Haloplanus natans]|uniref:hypothetical protein n=1 Tax=Haloplanus natans TaxID=376171 RepID=UPI00067784DC|nr:hypothetical protein [Haloplanus natans]